MPRADDRLESQQVVVAGILQIAAPRVLRERSCVAVADGGSRGGLAEERAACQRRAHDKAAQAARRAQLVDRTFAALAQALGKELVIWEDTRARIERRVQRMHAMGLLESPEVTEGNLRMARIPADPAHVFRNRRGMAPGTVYEANGKRIFVLPGVPLEMKGIFTEELEPQFLAAGSAATVRELRFTFAVEARFYPLMRELEGTFPDVSVGSYPNFETKELVIRVLGSDPKRVDEALDVIRKRAPV